MKLQLPKVTDDIKLALRELRRLLEELVRLPAVSGQYLTDSDGKEELVLVNGSVNKLQHKLGKRLRGWSLRDLRGASATGRVVRVLSSGNARANDERDLWLDVQGHGANITVKIWVE